MVPPDIVDVSAYSGRYRLAVDVLGLTEVKPELDLNNPGLVMHGSEADPLTIIQYGLAPHKGEDNADGEWEVCLGLNSGDPGLTLNRDLARKNSAVKYAGYFSDKGLVYLVDDDVKLYPSYREYWDEGDGGRGYAWVTQPIPPHLIQAVVTKNISLAAAALTAAGDRKHVYLPNGTCYLIEQL